MIGNIRIKAKSNGIDLYEHSEAVKDTAFILCAKCTVNIDRDVMYWASILHDLGKANPLFQSNMETQNSDKIMRHEIASVLFINVVPQIIRDETAFVILSHHKSINNDDRSIYKLYDENTDILYKNHIGNIEEWGKIVKDYLLCHYNIKINIPSYDECVEIIDYYVSKIDDLKKGYSLERGLFMMADHFASCFYNTSERLNVIEKLFNIPDISYYCNENPNYPLSLIKSNKNKKHTLCIAPTGAGKTNFMIKRCEDKRIFYTIPFQASINAMYCRIKHDTNELVGLQHGSVSSLSIIDDFTKTISSFYGLPITVITPFQIMSPLLRLKGYESKILDLYGQAVIFDELHTYGDMPLSYIMEMIRLLLTLNCSIHICTATMPSYLQNEIINLIGEENIQLVKLNETQLNSFNRHIIHTIDYFSTKDIINRYNQGEKVLVVRNTIGEAIKTYCIIKETHPNVKIMLLHSKFKRKRKAELEQILINNYNKINEPCILISTQVVEVSIDINFDVLFTDCADIMALIQRFGRINRQRINIGIYKDVFIMKPLKCTLPYDVEIVNKTYNVLSELNNQLLKEIDVQILIDKVHNVKKNLNYENASPYNKNGIWKNIRFSNVVNNSISKELCMEGYVGILESDFEEYNKTNNKDIEIPLNRINSKLNNFEKIMKGNKLIGFIIPDHFYSNEIGLNC